MAGRRSATPEKATWLKDPGVPFEERPDVSRREGIPHELFWEFTELYTRLAKVSAEFHVGEWALKPGFRADQLP
jgi:hypothetical protein